MAMQSSEPFAPFVARVLWPANGSSPTGWRRRLFNVGRVAYAVVRDLAEGKPALHAASLVYTTILSLVPLTALAFSVLKGFGVHFKFEPMLLSVLAPLGKEAPVIAERLLGFVDNMDVGVLGAVGLAVLFYTAISVVQKIEAAFNEIWHIRNARPMVRKFTDYLSVMLIGPVLMFSAFGVAASIRTSAPVQQLSEIRPLGALINAVETMAPFLLIAGAFSFLYKFLPYTRVHTRPALVGGGVAALIWAAAGAAFATFAQGAGSYAAIYSAFASLILFLIWLNVNWLIVLIGASVAFYVQHPEYMPVGSGSAILSNRSRERLGLGIIQAIGAAHYEGARALSSEDLRDRLGVPQETIERMLAALADGGLVSATADDPPRWLPTRAYDATPSKAAIDVVRTAGERRGLDLSRITVEPTVATTERRIAEAIDEALDGWTLTDLVTERTDAETTRPASVENHEGVLNVAHRVMPSQERR
jgi:membrane protein